MKTENSKELKGQDMVDFIMKRFNMTEEQTLKLLSEKLGNRNQSKQKLK